MGKRSDFVRVERDYYPTPIEAVRPLIPFLPEYFTYCEPCAGDGQLMVNLDNAAQEVEKEALCLAAFDIEPRGLGIKKKDALKLTLPDVTSWVEDEDMSCDYIITNPPWDRSKKSGYLLHNMIEVFSNLRPTWLLFDADWVHTRQSAPYVEKYLMCIVSVGRIKWYPESNQTGKDNCAWHLFWKDARKVQQYPEFFGRGITL